jgi:hypothetical protein
MYFRSRMYFVEQFELFYQQPWFVDLSRLLVPINHSCRSSGNIGREEVSYTILSRVWCKLNCISIMHKLNFFAMKLNRKCNSMQRAYFYSEIKIEWAREFSWIFEFFCYLSIELRNGMFTYFDFSFHLFYDQKDFAAAKKSRMCRHSVSQRIKIE